jgi:RimJ/RimL family protein N-acetyltransferase
MAHISLRRLELRDFPLFYKWWNDEELRKLTSDNHEPMPEAEIDEILARHLAREHYFDYMVESDGVPIGHILIEKLAEKRAKFYIAIGEKEAWGKGYGTMAIQEAIEKYLTQFPESVFELEVNQDNGRAIRAYEKAGFVKVGEKQYSKLKPVFRMERKV